MCVEDRDLSGEAEQRRSHCGGGGGGCVCVSVVSCRPVREEEPRAAALLTPSVLPLGSPGAQLSGCCLRSWQRTPGSQRLPAAPSGSQQLPVALSSSQQLSVAARTQACFQLFRLLLLLLLL